ncbi:MAG: TonB-dependent receptor [Bacteroidetes bacterium]|jgi:outer membrane receptor for ferrienterochelin and colicins|nr:TonB-dependent receptor [Bacteroidota bacterium]
MKTIPRISIVLLFLSVHVNAQKTDANIFGDVQNQGEHLAFVNVYVKGTSIGTVTDKTGHYMLINLPEGEHTIVANMMGYKPVEKKVNVQKNHSVEVNFILEEEVMSLNEVVVTGTKTFKRRTESPVMVNVTDSEMLESVQANTLSEGLNFQPGLRVETDCQTCNYTQLRMNGLGGSYSQILINGRPVFSPLTGLYGLEQIPSNMISQIEVVRGGGSSLYGSSAIGGTVNVITKLPGENNYSFSINHTLINGMAGDNMINGNISVVSTDGQAGLTLFATRRDREIYDHNKDNFSEKPQLKNNSFGATAYLKPSSNQKLELNLSSLYEYRYGGEITGSPAHKALQSEERDHNVLMGGLDYQLDFNNHQSAFIVYAAGQHTDREHYTGIVPDTSDIYEFNEHFFNPPYGTTQNSTYQTGIQVNHEWIDFLGVGGVNLFTLGIEYKYDDVYDEIEAYQYELDQTTENTGIFLQSDWSVLRELTLLSGVRVDKHNLIDKMVYNPRFSLLYNITTNLQFRTSWSTGFRAPQAFDSDMHIAFAGGGISRIRLANQLLPEHSDSYSASVNYDMPTEHYIYGFTLEGFYTRLQDAFVLEEVANDSLGLIYEKRNGPNSTVQGITAELRTNYDRKVQLEAGYTLQSSRYDEPVFSSESLPGHKNYLRTPEQYGYFTLTLTPGTKIKASISGIYTGPMELLHVVPPTNSDDSYDEFAQTEDFFELNAKISYTFDLQKVSSALEIFGGVQNILNAYQSDFDSGKDRDSNYIYGPANPISGFAGIRIRSLP